MKSKELREMTDDELRKKLDNLAKRLFNLRFRKVTDVVENPAAFRHGKKDIAKIKTILRERELKIDRKVTTTQGDVVKS